MLPSRAGEQRPPPAAQLPLRAVRQPRPRAHRHRRVQVQARPQRNRAPDGAEMANGTSTQPEMADRVTLDAVRPAVRDLLLSVPAYKQLSPEEQQKIASGMVKIASYIASPSGALTPPLSS